MRDPAFELNCFLTRSVYLVVAALMRGYPSTYEGEVRIALAALADRKGTMEDRLRLARDLHDGLLPSLTGSTLPPETARRRVERDSQTVGGSPIHIPGLLAAKHAPSGPSSGNGSRTGRRPPGWPASLTTPLEELGDRVKVQWGPPVVSSLDALDDRIPETAGGLSRIEEVPSYHAAHQGLGQGPIV